MKNKIQNALILAAGQGTRMGEIGTLLPKVLWPIFDKTILELQVLYARSLGIKSISINLYNYSDIILKHIEQSEIFKDVNILVEKEILDIGGAIHNFAAINNYKGNVLILNCDQFYFIDDRLSELGNLTASYHKILFTYPVKSQTGYNTLMIKDNFLREIINKDAQKSDSLMQTYTGVSLIELSSLKKIRGESKFFESVANFKNEKIYCLEQKTEEYWDFGTVERYYDSITYLVKTINSPGRFRQFIKESCRIDTVTDLDSIKMGGFIIKNREISYKKITQTL